MANVKIGDLTQAAKKLQTNGQAAAGIYAERAAASGNTWAENTAASEDNYEAGVREAMGRKAFGKGVQKAGGGKYANQIKAVGQGRFGDGMSKAGNAWGAGFGPIAAAVNGKDIGPRGPVGSPQNQQRAAAMAQAFRAARLGAA